MDIIFKANELTELNFLKYIHTNNIIYFEKNITNEHEIIKKVIANPKLNHYNYLLFYHWYERRYKTNVINAIVLRSINEVINVTKKELHNDVRDKMLEFMNSSRFLGYTIYFEYFYDFFPDIEKYNFNEFVGQDFSKYILELFPFCKEINYLSKKRFLRFQDKQLSKIESIGSLILYYNQNRLPSFYPHVFEDIKFYTHTPHQLLTKTRKEIENMVREEKSIPKIGEGWVSETLLYYTVKDVLDNYTVVQHASPDWLGRQHLDIFITELNIAIEYQGKQHTEPIAFFGGKEAFDKNVERDFRKMKLCEENNVILYYVYPDTDTDEFIRQLKIDINKLSRL